MMRAALERQSSAETAPSDAPRKRPRTRPPPPPKPTGVADAEGIDYNQFVESAYTVPLGSPGRRDGVHGFWRRLKRGVWSRVLSAIGSKMTNRMSYMRTQLIAAIAVTLLSCAHQESAAPPTAKTEAPRTPTQWEPGNYVINLYDAFGAGKDGMTQDFGFSALVRYNGKTILFDSGTNADLFKANTAALGIDLRDVDFAVASHAHFDHINGFDYLLEVNPNVKIYFPKDVFWGADMQFSVAGAEPGVAESLPTEQRYFHGEKEQLTFNQSGRFWNANVEYVGENTEIAEGITLIATRSPYMGYFTRYPSLGGIEGLEQGKDDVKTMGLPELSLNLATDDGDVLLVGCSHSMVTTIVETTRAHLKRDIGLVYGGYHLLPYNAAEVRAIAERMGGELGVARVAPTHCTGHAGFAVFHEVFGERYHVAGLGTTTPFPVSDS